MKIALGLGLTIAIFAAVLAYRFPPLNTDEVFIANHGWNLTGGQGQRYSLYDDIFAPAVYPWRDAFAQVSETFTNGWIGLWMRVLGRDYWHARLGCVSAGLIAFWLLCALAYKEGGDRAAWICAVLLALDPIFWLASIVVRAETILLAMSSLTLWLIGTLRPTFPWKRFLIGFLIGCLFAAHPNALPISFGIFAFWMIREPFSRKEAAYSLCGLLAAGMALLAFFDLNTLRMSAQTFHIQMMRPPLFTWPWSLRDWLGNAVHKLFMSETYYFSAAKARGWEMALALRSVAWGALLLGGSAAAVRGWRRGRPWTRHMAWPLGWIATWLGMALLVRKQEVLYALNFYPFLLPFISLYLSGVLSSQWKWGGILKAGAVALLLAAPIFFIRAVKTYQPLYSHPTQLFQALRVYLPDPHVKIVGPNLFWYDRELDHFRDLGAMTYSHWYTGGRRDAGVWLETWRPEIFITDDTFEHLFFRTPPTEKALSGLLGASAARLGTIDTGPGSYGTFTVYRLTWPSHGL